MAYVPSSDSVIAFQSPGSLLTAIQKAGSVMAVSGSFTPAGNQSVSGAVTAPPGSVMMTAQLAGSVMAVSGSFAPAANQSVSGTVQTDVRGSVGAVIIGGSIAVSVTPPANQSVSGTVTVNQGTNPWVQTGSVQGVMSVIGTLPVTQATTPWEVAIVAGSVAVGSPANQSVSGAVTAPAGSVMTVAQLAGSLLGTTVRSGSVISNAPAGSIMAVTVVSGSTLAFAPAGSVMSVTMPAGSTTAVLATQVTSPWIVAPNNSSMFAVPVGSYMTVQPPGSIMAVNATLTPGSVSGAVTAPPGSVMTTAQLAGSLLGVTVRSGSVISNAPAGSIMAVTVVSGSTLAFAPAGSLMAVVVNAGSIIANQAAGSLMTVINPAGSVTGTYWGLSPSIVGTYAEDAAHTTADKGIFVLGVRNDAVASFAAANLEYSPIGVDSAGRNVIKPFAPGESSQIGIASTVNFGTTTVASIRLFLAPGTGLKNYITDYNISNTGAATTLVSFVDEDASVMGRTIAPAGGGSNHSFATPLVTQLTNKAVGVIAATATSTLHITLGGYKAP